MKSGRVSTSSLHGIVLVLGVVLFTLLGVPAATGQVPVTVTVPSSPAPGAAASSEPPATEGRSRGPVQGALPRTGADLMLMVACGATLVVVGGFLLRIRRRAQGGNE